MFLVELCLSLQLPYEIVYTNLTRMLRLFLFLISIAFGILILRSPQLHNAITQLGSFGFIGAILAGVFFVISFSVVPATAVLITLTDIIDPLPLSILAGFGAMCGDYMLMRFLRSETDKLIREVEFRNHSFKMFLRSRLLAWLAPVIGAIIIASPFPDEIGVTLLGITKLETKKFLLLVFILDTIGIFAILTIGGIFI